MEAKHTAAIQRLVDKHTLDDAAKRRKDKVLGGANKALVVSGEGEDLESEVVDLAKRGRKNKALQGQMMVGKAIVNEYIAAQRALEEAKSQRVDPFQAAQSFMRLAELQSDDKKRQALLDMAAQLMQRAVAPLLAPSSPPPPSPSDDHEGEGY